MRSRGWSRSDKPSVAGFALDELGFQGRPMSVRLTLIRAEPACAAARCCANYIFNAAAATTSVRKLTRTPVIDGQAAIPSKRGR